jgi:hypothetical protein
VSHFESLWLCDAIVACQHMGIMGNKGKSFARMAM